MDQELKQYLDARFANIDARFANIDARFADIDARFAEQNAYIDARFDKQSEEMRKIETNLLTAFHHWARPMEIKQRNASDTVAGFEERLSLAEERIGKLERGEYGH